MEEGPRQTKKELPIDAPLPGLPTHKEAILDPAVGQGAGFAWLAVAMLGICAVVWLVMSKRGSGPAALNAAREASVTESAPRAGAARKPLPKSGPPVDVKGTLAGVMGQSAVVESGGRQFLIVAGSVPRDPVGSPCHLVGRIVGRSPDGTFLVEATGP